MSKPLVGTPAKSGAVGGVGGIALTGIAYLAGIDFDFTQFDLRLFLELTGLSGVLTGWFAKKTHETPAPPELTNSQPKEKSSVENADKFEFKRLKKNNFFFSQRSLKNLNECHEDLQRVAQRALTLSIWDFAIIEGKRTKAEQEILYAKGKSLTMNSRHLQDPSLALDFQVLGPNGWTWEVGPYYRDVTKAFKKAAKDLGISITCGIDWDSLVDAGHIELSRSVYPDQPAINLDIAA